MERELDTLIIIINAVLQRYIERGRLTQEEKLATLRVLFELMVRVVDSSGGMLYNNESSQSTEIIFR
jgi:hypothetical protein